MGAVQSRILQQLLPKPKEEFPLTGVQRVDDLITNAKEVIGTVTKPMQMVNEFKYRSFDLTPPAEATGLMEQAKSLVEAPKVLMAQNMKLFEEIPNVVKNPEKLLADPLNFSANLKRMIGDPMKIIEEYKDLVGKYMQLGDSSTDIIGLAKKYVEDYRKLITDDFQKIIDYLKELPEIIPIIQQSIEKLGTFENDLKAELTNFSGGLCQAGRSAYLIQHNINSANNYKKKYEEEFNVAKGVVDQAMEKKKEVEALVDKAKEFQAEAERTQQKVEEVKEEIIGYQAKAKDMIQRVEDLKNKQEEFKSLIANPTKVVDQAKEMAQGVLNSTQGIMDGVNKLKGFF